MWVQICIKIYCEFKIKLFNRSISRLFRVIFFIYNVLCMEHYLTRKTFLEHAGNIKVFI